MLKYSLYVFSCLFFAAVVEYRKLVYTTQVNSTFRARWLASSEVISQVLRGSANIHHYSPPLRWIIVNYYYLLLHGNVIRQKECETWELNLSFALYFAVPCFCVGLKCYTCVSHKSWTECERSLRVITCPAPEDEVCVKEQLVEHDDNSEEGTKNTFSKFCATAEACKNKHCKEAGKLCDPKCCHTDLCNMAVTIPPSPVTFTLCLLLVNFVVMFKWWKI